MMFVEKKKEKVSLSGSDMTELVRAVHEKGAVFRFKPTGSSMKPSICNNDMITVSPLKGIPPCPGEVVAFRHPQADRLILHRVIRKSQNSFFIKGDNLREIDSHIPMKNVLGVVTKVERKGRAIFWPDRFRHRFLTRLYFRGYLTRMNIRQGLRIFLRCVVTSLQQIPFYSRTARRLLYLKPFKIDYYLESDSHSIASSNKVFGNGLDESELENFRLPVKEKSLMRWSISLRINNRPAATLNIFRTPGDLSTGNWRFEKPQARIRYGGLGFEEILVQQAERILTRSWPGD
jgi:hypothetical protein